MVKFSKALLLNSFFNILSQTNFHIINASAGSGKTHSLVLAYLQMLLRDPTAKSFRHQLALTFTNKAVNEMKERILATLRSLSKPSSKQTHMSVSLCKSLNIDEQELAFRADQMLRNMLLEYGSFDVITLDKFTHRLVRTFARELQLPYGFEVVLDPSILLEETVNGIIEQVGQEEMLSKLLLDFSLQKVQAEKDWDVQKELNDFVSLLLNENDRKPIADIKNKSLAALLEDKQRLENALERTKKEAQKYATDALVFLDQNGLEAEDFTRKQLHKHLDDVQKEAFSKLYENQLELALAGEKPLYNKTLSAEKKTQIDQIQPQLYAFYKAIKSCVGQYIIVQRTLKSWTPRMLLQSMELRLDAIQDEKEMRLLGQFNKTISELVQNEPAPFIYERLGERYKHYFLDEFQDTSNLQWANLIPLLANALESEEIDGTPGSLLLVGDPKQAIYRWRGGDMKQYIKLINQTKNPFQVKAEQIVLDKNFRSGAEIVAFNHAFFLMLSQYFDHSDYQKIYGKGSQQKAQKEGGYVRVEAIPKKRTKEASIPFYIVKTLSAVGAALDQGFSQSDIAILVRKKDQATVIGSALSQESYAFVSSESMMVSHSKNVQLLIAFLQLTVAPNTGEYHKVILDILWELHPTTEDDYHAFALAHLHSQSDIFLKALGKRFDFSIRLQQFSELPIWDAVNELLFNLSQIDPNDAYVHFFREDIFEFTQTQNTSIASYLSHWKTQAEQLRIAMPDALNAIKLMTIHQAKGLEFPVVILPFMDTPVYPSVIEKVWYPFDEGSLKTIRWGWFNFSKDLQHCGPRAKQLYEGHRLNQQLDACNVLYVALTRAVKAMFIITQEEEKGDSTYAHWFKTYIETQGQEFNSETPFEQGYFEAVGQANKTTTKQKIDRFSSTLVLSNAWKRCLVQTSSYKDRLQEAQDLGLLIHELLSRVIVAGQIPQVIQKAIEQNILSQEIKPSVEQKLLEIVNHLELASFYSGEDRVLCEQDLLVPNGPTLRPDRINFSNSGKVSILDYKTGMPKKEDAEQIQRYAVALNDLGFDQVEKVLVYINSEIQIIKKN